MTQEEFNKAPLLDQILYDETGMLVENHPGIAEAMEKYHQAKLKLLGIAVLRSVSNSASKKGTGTYMIVITLISALCAGMVGYGFKSLDAAIVVGLFINTSLCGAVRFNQ